VSNDLRRGIVANERSSDTRPVPRRIGTWILQGVVACAFFAAGATKLAAAPFEVQLFAQIGLGQWFALNREIPVCAGLRGGAGRTRTSNQTVIAETRVNQGSPH
jgi:hypothetical protein